jgi:hypothetical protein
VLGRVRCEVVLKVESEVERNVEWEKMNVMTLSSEHYCLVCSDPGVVRERGWGWPYVCV